MLTAPAISGLDPAFPVATGSAQPLTINGSNFQSGCVVTLQDITTNTTYANRPISSQTSTQIVINPNFGTAQDVWLVQVTNPDYVSSAQFDFALTPASKPQPTRFGVDYSFARPAPTTLQASGSTFAVRYVSPAPNNKNISLSEAQSLQAAGQDVILVFENAANQMLNGYSQGVADANTAVSVATAAGAPANFFCYFAADFEVLQAQYPAINAYLNGASSVMGLSRVGIYGSYYAVAESLNAGVASKGWQTVAWSYGLEDSRISLFQYATHIFGTSCDVDVGFGSNLGQWSPPTPTGLRASAPGVQNLSVSWSATNVATSYTLNRATSSSGPWTQVYSGASTSYADSGLQIGTTYYYEVSANNGGGSSAFSSSVSATTMKTMTWTGGGTDANWSTVANWGGAAPVDGCDLVFAGSTGLNTTNDIAAGTQFGNLTFNAGAGAFILNGNSLTLSGTITNNSASTQTINLTLGGTNGLAKTGAGMVILAAANNFTGGTLVTGGTLQVSTPAALPDGSNLSIGANVLTAFAAPVVPAATAAAAAVYAPINTSVNAAPAAPSDRTLSVFNKSIQAALADARWRKAVWREHWANWPPFDDRQDRTIPPLAAHDAVLADYWPGT